MARSSLLLACALVAALALLASPISHAASQLLGYRLVWHPDHSLTLQSSDGQLLDTLKPGQHVTVRNGSDVLTLSLRRATPVPQTPWTPPAPPSSGASPQQLLLAAINADRATHKVAPLALDARQSRCSLQHSRHMAKEGYISHDQFPTDVCTSHTLEGENVGVSTEGDPAHAVLFLHHAMMAEGPCPHAGCPGDEHATHGHYLNLVNPAYVHIGIGIFSQNGVTWLTEDFTN